MYTTVKLDGGSMVQAVSMVCEKLMAAVGLMDGRANRSEVNKFKKKKNSVVSRPYM